MLCAAQEEMPAPCAPPMAGSDEQIFSLAAALAVALETHTGENAVSGKKTHQEIFSKNHTIAVGATWVKCQKTHWDSGTWRPESVLGPTIYGYDGHGSVRQLFDNTGAVTDSYDYDAFGNLTNSTGSTPNNYLFAGEQYDPALNLYYNRARYLNTATGRFWTMDTQEPTPLDPTSLHRYLYATANPVDNVDPTGLYTQQFGYDVEAVVGPAYQSDYPTSNVSLGGWAKLPGAWRLKPDILDFTRNIWMEIKPLSISGITRAAASWGLYSAAFAPSGIYPDVTWLQNSRMFTVDNQPTLVFNMGGILFYTTNKSDYDLLNEVAQGALGFGISAAVGAAAGQLVNTVVGQGSELQTINNLVQIGIKGGEAEVEIDTAVDLVPAA